MTPEQTVQNNQIKELDVIKGLEDEVSNLKNGQKKIVEVVEKLQDTVDFEVKEQNEFTKSVKEEFDKGAKKFDSLESDIEMLKENMQIGFNEIKTAIRDKEMQEVKDQLTLMTKSKDTKENRNSMLKNGLIIAVATVIGTAIFTNVPHVSFAKSKLLPVAAKRGIQGD